MKSEDNEICFVFVYLGKDIPEYVYENIIRTISIFPHVQTWLITDQLDFDRFSVVPNLKYYLFERNYRDKNSNIEISNLDRNFRNGFWQLTLERILALTEFHTKFNNKKIIHIESDVIVFPNFPINKFKVNDKLSWTIQNDIEDSPAIIFLPNMNESKWLEFEILKRIKGFDSHTDMSILAAIRNFAPERVNVLPSNKVIDNEIIAKNEKTNVSLCYKASDSRNFDGIFDSLTLGIWIAGIDPRNFYGFTKLHSRNLIDFSFTVIDPSSAKYVNDKDGNLFIESKTSLTPIYNLHVHSKNRYLFTNNEWKTELARLTSLANLITHPILDSFSIRLLLSLLVKNIRDRTFFSYMRNIPFIKNILSH